MFLLKIFIKILIGSYNPSETQRHICYYSELSRSVSVFLFSAFPSEDTVWKPLSQVIKKNMKNQNIGKFFSVLYKVENKWIYYKFSTKK